MTENRDKRDLAGPMEVDAVERNGGALVCFTQEVNCFGKLPSNRFVYRNLKHPRFLGFASGTVCSEVHS